MDNLKLLLVDDDFYIYTDLRSFFESKGVKVLASKEEHGIINSFAAAERAVLSEQPDIAVLDVDIDGKKDGIELGAWLISNYTIPVIYLTNNYFNENLQRAKEQKDCLFLIKSQNVIHKEQLWVSFSLEVDKRIAHKQKTTTYVSALKLKESELNTFSKYQKSKDAERIVYPLVDIDWAKICKVYPLNNVGLKNKVFAKLHQQEYGYIIPDSSLSQVLKTLPDYFVQFSQDLLVNQRYLNHSKIKTIYYLDGEKIELKDTYKQKTLEQINKMQESRVIN